MAYNLDLSGASPLNKVTSTITRKSITDKWFFVIPGGVFYTKDLVVVNTFSGAELKPLTQYRALHLNKDATMASGLETATVILVTDDTVSEVRITRQVVGGVYETIGTDIDQIVSEKDLNDLTASAWGQIIGKPTQYPFDPHMHYDEQVYGLEHVIYLLDEIVEAIRTGDKNMFGMFTQYIDRQSAALKSSVDQKLDTLIQTLNTTTENTKLGKGAVITMYTNENPATVYKYGTWQKLGETFLRGVAQDADLGGQKKLGEGPDYNVIGVYFWRLVSV